MMKDLLLIYCQEEAGQWTDYIKSTFTDFRENISIELIDVESSLSSVNSLCSTVRVISLVISPSMLDLLMDEVGTFRQCLESSCVAAIELFLKPDELDTKLTTEYSVSKWKRATFGENEEENKTCVNNILALIDQQTSASSKPTKIDFRKQLADCIVKSPVGAGGPGKSVLKPNSSFESNPDEDNCEETESVEVKEVAKRKISAEDSPQTKESILQDICPDCIRKANEKVVLVFKREIKENQTLQVRLDDKMYDTKRHNPYCYSFKAPARKPGSVEVYIFINGAKICKRKVRYLSVPDLAYTFPQYIQELLGIADLETLDQHLTAMFKSSVPCDETLSHIFTPKNLATTSSQHSEDVLPTLLHFACVYGLQNLCMHITDLPGSSFALQIFNNEGKTPIDLAKEAGNDEIVEYLETFTEMHNYMLDIEEIYEQMTVIQSTPGYMDMEGGQVLADGYSVGRVRGQQEHEIIYERPEPQDDYEITSAKICEVQEVAPEEDIKQEDIEDSAPVIPPKPGVKRFPSEEGPKKPPEHAPPGRPPKPGAATSPVEVTDPFKEVLPPTKASMRSQALDELLDLQDSFKHGELSMTDIETLFKAWQLRNASKSSSMKSRQQMMNNMKEQHKNTIQMAAKKPSFLQRMKGSKKPDPAANLRIQHSVTIPNSYETFHQMQGIASRAGNRDSSSSTGSRSSISSSSSGRSRDSNFDPVEELEERPTPPPRPDSTLPKQSRLPKPPTRPFMPSSQPNTVPKIPPRKY